MPTVKTNLSQFVVGTAQLGMPYGIKNKSGRPDQAEAFEMIQCAIREDVIFFDTAQAYGDSEKILGNCFEALHAADKVRVITKLDPSTEASSAQTILDTVHVSLRQLKISSLFGCLLHRGKELDAWSGKYEDIFMQLKRAGMIQHAGVSIYSESEFKKALQIKEIDLIQLPFNLIDQRAAREGWFEAAEAAGKKIFIRSIYLQGFLLMQPEELPTYMLFAQPILKAVVRLCRELQMNPQELAFSFALNQSKNSFMVVGAETQKQLADNIQLFKLTQKPVSQEPLEAFYQTMQSDPGYARLIDPSQWHSR
ncbi:MAG: hypothetical protein COV74_09595 [Candidatus Omnitrophica bacterium CG11_big_fil_rev_8_21_14_0_20_45_26]|uniref:NADP-dependent oxidoreductase domain-containing protein n=1 Tax=Candidatus Abzuiibacterium crystallinum TaxID=1974748 RepID=A0A2H0LLB3_9BACT|nr:MAG: hypothetical protein COV74_09595 [Candidatus Omnitrophica bacterium CG11_big_fil_rev_8_21_14_0_20_45_26]PIW65398.1 MAG: hypothetical protein COW12_02165 [Candidatus Omnitrophica bacterium CG12_big_fil_rev_8_21_14_0_65_45_16]